MITSLITLPMTLSTKSNSMTQKITKFRVKYTWKIINWNQLGNNHLIWAHKFIEKVLTKNLLTHSLLKIKGTVSQ